MSRQSFGFQVDLNVINHLGVGLYSSMPAALTELVSNAWDADAQNVWITVDQAQDSITIEDDGHGMDEAAIENKFLTVGYARRGKNQGRKSQSGKRDVMGRKGIGKLSMFALSDFVRISSKTANANIIGFEIDVPKLKDELQNNRKADLPIFQADRLKSQTGTKIELKKISRNLDSTENYLRKRLSRRFSILGQIHNFKVFLNGVEITEADREIQKHFQFLWAFDQQTLDRVKALSPNIASVPDMQTPTTMVPCTEILAASITFPDQTTSSVRGYIASAAKPAMLGARGDSANMISIFANGRVFEENILPSINSAKIYQRYLTGEIHADFLDEDDIDRATASREAIKADDPKYKSLLAFLNTTLNAIDTQWEEWRNLSTAGGPSGGNAAVDEWLSNIEDPRDKKEATRLISRITNAEFSVNEQKDAWAKTFIYKGTIIAFERLKITKNLHKLSSIDDVLSPEFAALFTAISNIEEAYYADITKQRLEVIKKFKEIKDDPRTLEKVAQKYLFENLWLLDPAWDRVSGRS